MSFLQKTRRNENKCYRLVFTSDGADGVGVVGTLTTLVVNIENRSRTRPIFELGRIERFLCFLTSRAAYNPSERVTSLVLKTIDNRS